jgi:hypothetical protein
MFIREKTNLKVSELGDIVDPLSGEVVVVSPNNVSVDFAESRTIRLNTTNSNIEMPMTEQGVKALSKWLDVPFKFLERQDSDLKQHIVSALIRKTSGDVTFEFNDQFGLLDARDPNALVISPRRYAEIASRVLSPDADVVEVNVSPELVQFEVVAPESLERGWGGDRQVNDLTVGGIRMGQNRKANTAPFVQPYLYRLICTNGMETRDDLLKVDARGQTVDELLVSLEMQARQAFGRVESEIASFYDLRNERVSDPTQTLIRMAGEAGLSDRTVLAIAERLPEFTQDASNVTMFDLINSITNAANDPAIRNRVAVRRTMEQAGGQQVISHIARCGHCRGRLH